MTDETNRAPTEIDLDKLIERIQSDLPQSVHFTFTMDGNDPTVAFTVPAAGLVDDKIEKVGEWAYMMMRLAFKFRNYDCEEDDKHSKWEGKGYA